MQHIEHLSLPPEEWLVDLPVQEKSAAPVPQQAAVTRTRNMALICHIQVGILITFYGVLLTFAIWLLFDTWSSKFTLLKMLGVNGPALSEPLLQTINYAVVGGFMGSILYHIRQLYHYYLKNKYDPRWFGKYLTAPLEGAIMAIVVLALIRGGASLFGGSSESEVTGATNFTVFGTGALVGFSTRDVVAWLEGLAGSRFGDKKDDDDPAQGGRGNTD